MNIVKNVGLGAVMLVMALGAANAFGQTNARVTIGEAGGPAGGQATISWGYENLTDVVSSYSFVIEFDQTQLEPEVTGANRNVVGCFANLPAEWGGFLSTCRNVADSGEIVVVVAEQSGAGIGDFLTFPTTPEIGTITFNISAAAGEGDTFPLDGVLLTATDVSIEDVSADFEIVDGQLEVLGITAVLNVTPDNIAFPPTQTGGTSAPQPVTIANEGTDGIDLEVTAINLSNSADFGFEGGGSCPAVPFTLADGEQCTQHVEFTPQADGPATSTLTVVSNAGVVTNDTVDLTGTGVPSDANLAIAPPSHDYGTLDINAPAGTQTFTVSNTGVNDTVTGIAVGAVAAPFATTANTCGATLAPGASCQITITFDPAAPGSFTDTLTVTSDANDVSADLEGEGVSAPNIVVNPPFGPVNLGTAPAGGQTQASGTLQNTGSADGDVACTLAGPAGVFSTSPSPLAATVAPGATVNFTLFCDIPDTADVGDTFNGTLSCTVNGDVAGTHDLSCSAGVALPAIPVNTLQPWALVLFALMMLLVGGISIRFVRMS